ncbi:hypothetical protein ACOME3_010028 [Neoechinorhynchus agilis]
MIRLSRRRSITASSLCDESHLRVQIRQYILFINIFTGIFVGLICLRFGAMEQKMNIRSRNFGNVYIIANFFSSLASIAVKWQSRANSPAMFHLRDRLASCIVGTIFSNFFIAVITLNLRQILAGTWRDDISVEGNFQLQTSMLFVLVLHLVLGIIGLLFKVSLSFFHLTPASGSYSAQVIFDCTILLLAVTGSISQSLYGTARTKMIVLDDCIQILIATGFILVGGSALSKLMTVSIGDLHGRYVKLLSERQMGENLIKSRLTAFDSDEDAQLELRERCEQEVNKNDESPLLQRISNV